MPAGYRINEYSIERPLGGGGFGITYLARDSNLQLPVAIKEYFPSDLVTRGPDQEVQVRGANSEHQEQYDWGLERFLDEARALATFRHPNIVRVLRYFRENGTAYIVMEYESGLSLKRWVPQNAPLSQRALLSIVLPAARWPGSRAQDGFPAPRHQARQHLRARRRHAGAARFRRGPPRHGRPGHDQHRQSRFRRLSSNTTRRATRAPGPTSIPWAQ